MYSKDWQSKLVAGAVLLAGIAMAALGADAPPPDAKEPSCDRHGSVDLAKMKEHAASVFTAADTNGDGKITQAEFLAYKPQPDGKGGHGMGMRGGMGIGGGMGMMGMGMGGPDGKASPEREAAAAAFQAELFKELDTDHNGQLSSAEFSKAREAMHSDTMHTFMKTQMFARLDKNADGVLTKDEFPPFAQKMATMDTNADGTVTHEEMKAAHKSMKGAQTGKPQG
jgi:Ca2+-binding EF-hand superfamily protein